MSDEDQLASAYGLVYDDEGRILYYTRGPYNQSFDWLPNVIKSPFQPDAEISETHWVSGGELFPRSKSTPNMWVDDSSKYMDETIVLNEVPSGATVVITCVSSAYFSELDRVGFRIEFVADGSPVEFTAEFPGVYLITADPFPLLKEEFQVEFLLQ